MPKSLDSLYVQTIAHYVRSHGFAALVIDGAVTFGVPYTIEVAPGKWSHGGYETHTVRTYQEARNALGY
jgi:hypothetical protein